MLQATRRVVQYLALPALVGAVIISTNPHAEARPQYLKQFAETYPGLSEPLTETKCGLCHTPGSKKERIAYGEALLKALKDGENVKDVKQLTAALRATEGMPSSTAETTFGQLIQDGKLPR